jgi:O-methyltransferase involved in polyketide biosynthesis
MYDYYLGGKDNFAADRAAADRAIAAWPAIRVAARENRAFLGRAVRFLAGEAGVDQFLDIGSGLPTASNVHQVAQEIVPVARVVYVDNDPIVLAHARALLASSREGRCAYVHADLRDPEKILAGAREALNFSRPIALILSAVLPFVLDEDKPAQIVKTLIDALPSGSYVAASHGTPEYLSQQVQQKLGAVYTKGTAQAASRDSAEFADLVFPGLELVPPGVVLTSEWRPDPASGPRPSASEVSSNSAVARKP